MFFKSKKQKERERKTAEHNVLQDEYAEQYHDLIDFAGPGDSFVYLGKRFVVVFVHSGMDIVNIRPHIKAEYVGANGVVADKEFNHNFLPALMAEAEREDNKTQIGPEDVT